MNITLFPEEFLALQEELIHPFNQDICQKLGPHKPFGDALGDIAAHFQIILEGMYDVEDQKRIAKILTDRMKERRHKAETINVRTLQ